MCSSCEAVSAADYLLAKVYRVPVLKALNPTKARDYQVIVRRMNEAIQGAVRGKEDAAIKAAIRKLDVDWTRMTTAQRAKVIEAAKAALASVPAGIIEPVNLILTAQGKQVVEGTKVAIKDQYKLKVTPTLTKTDLTMVQSMTTAQNLYIRDEYGRRQDAFANTARTIVQNGLEQGLSRQDIGAKLDAKLTEQGINQSRSYWTMVAATFANRTRTLGSLSSYKDNGITRYTFEAVMDEVTSLICRFLDGKTFEVKTALGKYEEVAVAKDPEDVRYIMPWSNTGKDENGNEVLYTKDAEGNRTVLAEVTRNAVGESDEPGEFNALVDDEELADMGVMVPPLHGLCRSRIIPDL